MRSLFLFDMTFWLYLAALGLYVAYLVRETSRHAAGSGRTSDGQLSKNVMAPGPPNWDKWLRWSRCSDGC